MDPTDLLQRIGLNKYEAEAYLSLLAEGPLTGYERASARPCRSRAAMMSLSG